MNRRDKTVFGFTIAGIFLAVGVGVASAKGKKDDGDDDGDDGSKPRPGRAGGDCKKAEGKLRLPDGSCVDDPNFGFDDDLVDEDDDDYTCPTGMVRNAARLRVLGQVASGQLTEAQGRAELDKYPICVPADCPDGTVRGEYGDCVFSDPPLPPPADPDPARPRPPRAPRASDDIDDYIKVFPEDGAYYQIKYGDILGWGTGGMNWDAVSQNVLGRALFLAAREYGGMADAQAQAYANARRKNTTLTNRIYNALLCCTHNDACYGTWGYCGDKAIQDGRCPSTMRNRPGEHGRAIRPLPQHADNQARIRAGLTPARVVDELTPAQKGNGRSKAVGSASPGGNSSFPLLWIPGIDRKKLWETDGKVVEFTTSKANPPDFIWDRGFEDYSNSTTNPWGCAFSGFDGVQEF